VFLRAADTIVYVLPPQRQNNSITDLEVAAQVRYDHPQLVDVLVEVSKYAGLAPSSITRGIPRMEDIITRTDNTFGFFIYFYIDKALLKYIFF
jgi:hypothetical protein